MRRRIEKILEGNYQNPYVHDKPSDCYNSSIHPLYNCPNVLLKGEWSINYNPLEPTPNGYFVSNNLIQAGSFETFESKYWKYLITSNWDATDTSVATRVTNYYYDGTACIRCGTGAQANGRGISTAYLIPVTPRKTYLLSFYGYVTDVNSQYILLIRLYDKNKNDITVNKNVYQWAHYSSGYLSLYKANLLSQANTWQLVTIPITVPEDVYYIRLGFAHYTNGDYYFYFDRISLVPISDSETIVIPFNGDKITLVYGCNDDTGIFYYSVDGGAETAVDTYQPFSQNNKRGVLRITGLQNGQHYLTIRTSSTKNPNSKGYTVNLYYYTTGAYKQTINLVVPKAIRPKIYLEPEEKIQVLDFKGKTAGDDTTNKNKAYYATTSSMPIPSSSLWTELTDYTPLERIDEQSFTVTATQSGTYARKMFAFDLTSIDPDVTRLKNNIKSLEFIYKGKALSLHPQGHSGYSVYIWNSNSWVLFPDTSGGYSNGIPFVRNSTRYGINGELNPVNAPYFFVGRFYNFLTPNQSYPSSGTDGFNAVGSGVTLSQLIDRNYPGIYHLKVECNGSQAGQGFQITPVDVWADNPYTASLYLRGSGNVVLKLIEYDAYGNVVGETATNITLSSTRTRYSVTRTFSSRGFKASIQVVTNTAQNVTFYADCLALHMGTEPLAWNLGQTGKGLIVETNTGANNFTNSGFEAGNLSGWTVNNYGGSGSATINTNPIGIHSGNYSCLVNGGSSGVSLTQTLGAPFTTNYVAWITFWVKAQDGSNVDKNTVRVILNGTEYDFDYIMPFLNGWYFCSYRIGNGTVVNSAGIKVFPNKVIYIDDAVCVHSTRNVAPVFYYPSTASSDTLYLRLYGMNPRYKGTIKFWMYTYHLNSGSYQLITLSSDGGTVRIYIGKHPTNNAGFMGILNNSGAYIATYYLNNAATRGWHLFKVVFDYPYIRGYIDNQLIGSFTYSPNMQFTYPLSLICSPYYGPIFISNFYVSNIPEDSPDDLTSPPPITANTVVYAPLDGNLETYSIYRVRLTSNPSYEEKDALTYKTTQQILSSYIQQDGKVYIAVFTQNATNADCNSSLSTDYAALKVTYKSASSPEIVCSSFNILSNSKPEGEHLKPITEWNNEQGAYPHVFDAKENAIKVTAPSLAARPLGNKLELEPGQTYYITGEYKGEGAVIVVAFRETNTISNVPYTSFNLSPSSDYTMFKFSFTALGTPAYISFYNTGNVSYFRKISVSTEDVDFYREGDTRKLSTGVNTPLIMQENELLIIDTQNKEVTYNSTNISQNINSDFYGNPIELKSGDNIIKYKGGGAFKMTIEYEE